MKLFIDTRPGLARPGPAGPAGPDRNRFRFHRFGFPFRFRQFGS